MVDLTISGNTMGDHTFNMGGVSSSLGTLWEILRSIAWDGGLIINWTGDFTISWNTVQVLIISLGREVLQSV